MKKLLALILLSVAAVTPSAYGFFGSYCCDGDDTHYTYRHGCGCPVDNCPC